ncbi:MAG: outer membrane protein, partial [Nitrospinales bacterium]
IAAPSSADDREGFYLSLSGLFGIAEDSPIHSQNFGATPAATNAVLNALNAKVDTGIGLSFAHAAGFKFDSGFRAEAEFSYRDADLDRAFSSAGSTVINGDINIKSWLFNAVYDFETYTRFTPYLGYGVGVALQEGSLSTIGGIPAGLGKGTDVTFAYQILTGVVYSLNDNVDVGVGYRYFGTSNPDFGFFASEIDIHNLEVTLRYYFF